MDVLIEILKNNDLFATFNEDELIALISYCEQVNAAQNETIFIEGKSDDAAVYFIQSGAVKIFKGLDHRAKTLALFSPGNVFGEMSFLDPEPRSASAVAAEETIVFKLIPERFSEFANKYPKAAMKLYKLFVKKLVIRLRQTNETVLTRAENIITN